MIAIVCGGRDYDDYNAVSEECYKQGVTLLINGGCSGADSLAKTWAVNAGVPHVTVQADWSKYGKAAGPIRNAIMLRLRPEILIAFPGGKGTADMIAQAAKKREVVTIIRAGGGE